MSCAPKTAFSKPSATRVLPGFTIATQAAERHGLTFRRDIDSDDDPRLAHQALPNLVRALDTGQNSGAVLGGGPGVLRAGRLTDHVAYRYANFLQKGRKFADYDYGTVPAPYDVPRRTNTGHGRITSSRT